MLTNAFQPDQIYLKQTSVDKETGHTKQIYGGGLPVVLRLASELMTGMLANGQDPNATKALNLAFQLITAYNEKYQELERLALKAQAEGKAEAVEE